MAKMPKRKDKKVFQRTAAKSKKMNIAPKIFRGGINQFIKRHKKTTFLEDGLIIHQIEQKFNYVQQSKICWPN
jgi:hypothetical protein